MPTPPRKNPQYAEPPISCGSAFLFSGKWSYVLITISLLLLNIPKASAADIVGKVIDSYVRNDVTHCTLEVKQPLIPGKSISLSNMEVIVVNEMLGEKDGLYYYDASAQGKPNIAPGTDVFNEEVKEIIKGRLMFLNLERKRTFEPKKWGEITAVHQDRALMDKGSLHEVRENDIYMVFDSSGKYKSMIELRGIGDFQSQGKLYHTLEDWGTHRAIEAGDKVKYMGQRKPFGFGILIGSFYPKTIEHSEAYVAGVLWSLTFKDGWGGEILFGGLFEKVNTVHTVLTTDATGREIAKPVLDPIDHRGVTDGREGSELEMQILGPIMIRKNFFYPRTISPYFALGAAYVSAKYRAVRIIPVDIELDPKITARAQGRMIIQQTQRQMAAPVVGLGVDLFSTKLFHLRFDAKYYYIPTLEAPIDPLQIRGVTYSAAVITGW